MPSWLGARPGTMMSVEIETSAVLTGNAPQVRRALYGSAGHALSIEADDPHAWQVLESTYEPLQILASGRAPLHTASLRRLSDGRLHARFDRRVVPTSDGGSMLTSAYYALKEIFARFSAAQTGHIAFYGALVRSGNGALLLLGPTACGKSVLAMHLASLGATFLGDETATLDVHAATMRAVARRPALRESALAYVPQNLRASIEVAPFMVNSVRGRLWYALRPEDLGGIAPSGESVRLKTVCIIRGRSERPALRRLNLGEALPAMLQRTYSRPSQLLEIASLKRALRGVSFCDVDLGDPRDTAAMLLGEVAACA